MGGCAGHAGHHTATAMDQLQAVIRIEQASSTGDDIVVTDEFNQQTMFHTIRQQQVKAGGLPNYRWQISLHPKTAG